jgi:hypothetical protein
VVGGPTVGGGGQSRRGGRAEAGMRKKRRQAELDVRKTSRHEIDIVRRKGVERSPTVRPVAQ